MHLPDNDFTAGGWRIRTDSHAGRHRVGEGQMGSGTERTAPHSEAQQSAEHGHLPDQGGAGQFVDAHPECVELVDYRPGPNSGGHGGWAVLHRFGPVGDSSDRGVEEDHPDLAYCRGADLGGVVRKAATYSPGADSRLGDS